MQSLNARESYYVTGVCFQYADYNDDLSNFIYSVGGACTFTDAFSLNVKLVNGVNGQDEVLRIDGLWSF